jgi:hypothetical protein
LTAKPQARPYGKLFGIIIFSHLRAKTQSFFLPHLRENAEYEIYSNRPIGLMMARDLAQRGHDQGVGFIDLLDQASTSGMCRLSKYLAR